VITLTSVRESLLAERMILDLRHGHTDRREHIALRDPGA
jgi:hypothetical protein